MNITASIYNDNDDEILVTGDYNPPSRGKRDKWGAQMEPDEPDGIEDISATVDGVDYELNEEEKSRAIFALWEAVSDSLNNE